MHGLGPLKASITREEPHAYAAADLHFFACGREVACGVAELEEDDVAAVLVRTEDPLAGGVDIEVARDLAAAGSVAEMGERACRFIEGEACDGVVRAAADIDELSVWMHARFGGGEPDSQGTSLGNTETVPKVRAEPLSAS